MKKALFVDANTMLYVALYGKRRAKFPCPDDKVPLSRFISWIGDLIRGTSTPDYMAAAFDPPGKNWRNLAYDGYKQHRGAKDDEFGLLRIQACQYLRGLGVASGVCPGYEADDALGALCEAMPDDVHSVVYTNDKDLYQLASERVSLMDMLGDVRGPERAERAMGVAPHLVPDYLALAGDAADNIPGAKGIGAAHARKLLQQFPGGLEDIIKNLEHVPASMSAALGDPALMLYKQLTSLDTSAPITRFLTPNAGGSFELPEKLNWQWSYEYCQSHGIKTRKPR